MSVLLYTIAFVEPLLRLGDESLCVPGSFSRTTRPTD